MSQIDPFSPSDLAAQLYLRHRDSAPIFDERAIESMIPHREPFLLIDRILEFDAEQRVVVGRKDTAPDEFFFQGHFPQKPIMPGVLLIESLAQTGGVLIHLMGFCGKIPMIVHLNKVRFRHSVRPTDQILTHCRGLHLSSRGGRIQALACLGSSPCAEAEIGYVLADPENV